jgi:CheY-like chemotaxis protein
MTTKKTILTVDDEEDTLAFLTALFQDNGYATLEAVNGVQAVQLARAHKPDLITLDMTMPDQSGVRTIRELRADPALAKIPIVVVTGIGESMNTFIKKMPGFPQPEGFVSKPIDRTVLLEAVKRLIG